MTREDQVRLLLRTKDDYLPSIGRTEFASAPGAAPSKRRCAECGGTGRRLVVDRDTRRKHFRMCLACNGAGWCKATKAEISAGEASDPYIPTVTGGALVAQAERETMTVQEIDRSLERLNADWFGGETRYRDPRDAHDRTGSYRELRVCLELMQQQQYPLWEAVGAVLRAWERDSQVRGHLALLELEAVSWLAERMPTPIRVPQQEEQKEARQSIVELAAAGWKHRRIARYLGVELRTVKRAVATT